MSERDEHWSKLNTDLLMRAILTPIRNGLEEIIIIANLY